ncbi:MAG: DUF4426 domain-containing protein [Plesiomonas shigelloides]
MLRQLCAIVLFSASLCGIALAEQKEQIGQFDIHYMALPTTFLTPAVAKTYGIERSNYTGLVNITVLNTGEPGNPAVPVEISGTANNLINARIELRFKEVREGPAIYYIAQVPVNNDEELHFDVAIKNGTKLNTTLKFKQKFFIE